MLVTAMLMEGVEEDFEQAVYWYTQSATGIC